MADKTAVGRAHSANRQQRRKKKHLIEAAPFGHLHQMLRTAVQGDVGAFAHQSKLKEFWRSKRGSGWLCPAPKSKDIKFLPKKWSSGSVQKEPNTKLKTPMNNFHPPNSNFRKVRTARETFSGCFGSFSDSSLFSDCFNRFRIASDCFQTVSDIFWIVFYHFRWFQMF